MALGLPFLVVVSISGLALWSELSGRQLQAQFDHTERAGSRIQQLLTLSVDAETGVRGYALTRRSSFLAPYTLARRQLPEVSAQLRAQASGDPILHSQLPKLQSDAAAAMGALAQLRRQASASPSSLYPLLLRGKHLMDLLRREVAATQTALASRLDREELAASNQASLTVSLIGLGALLALLGGGLLMRAFTANLVARVKLLQLHAAALAGSSEGLPPLPGGRDELGELAASLGQAGALLEQRTLALEQRGELLAAVLAAIPDVIVQFDAAGRVAMVSSSLGRVFGEPARQEDLRHISSRSPEAAGQLQDLVFRKLSGEEINRTRLSFQHADGHPIVVELRFGALREQGKTIGVVVAGRDVTEQVRWEEEISSLRRAAEAATQAKSEFLSRVSHELRTPLNGILGFAQLLSADATTEDQRDSAARILRGGRHLLELIDEILDISRIEARELSMSIESVQVNDLLASSVELIRPMAAERGIELVMPGGPAAAECVLADRQRARQILLNLLSNAVKYNRDGGRIELEVRREGAEVAVSVRDTGAGIPPERMQRLFTPFDRLGAERSQIEGTGLGLSLSLALARAMGGRLEARSDPGLGSNFTLYLPRSELPEGRSASPGEPSIDGLRGKILYIEDNLQNTALVEKLLMRQGQLQLVIAMQGSLGLELARRQHPQAILLDLNLPDLSGEEVLARLKADPLTREIPVLIFSADASASRRRNLLELGASAYLTKPVDLGQFGAALAAALSLQGEA